jgi:glutaredoxin 3
MYVPHPNDSEHAVVMYVTDFCPYCVMAKQLLTRLGIDFELFEVDGNVQARNWLVQATQQRTVPQIFIRGQSIGGYQELARMHRRGKLEAALAASA